MSSESMLAPNLADTSLCQRPTPERRIAYVLSQFPCYDETFILREIKALSERGVKMTVLSLRSLRQPLVQADALPFIPDTRYIGYAAPAVIAATLRALFRQPRTVAGLIGLIAAGVWRKPRVLLKSLVLFPKALYFAELVARTGIEHIHAHWATYPATTALVISRLTGIPWSFTCHAHDIFNEPHFLAEKLTSARFALTCTADNKRYLETVNPLARERVHVSYHGLDLSRFEPPSARPAGRVVRVLAVGSLLECKGFKYLIEATGLLCERGRKLEVTIAGGGPLETELKELARSRGVAEHVRFTGYLSQERLIPLYQESDLFALPAVREIHWGIPNVLIEALACELPVVTTGLPSLPELIEDGVQGLVVENRNARDLADKIERLVDDGALRRRMGKAGRASVLERFDIARTIDTVLEPLLASAAGGTHPFKRSEHASPASRRARRLVGRLTRLAAEPRRAPAVRVLMYHRVNDSHPGDRLSVTPDAFESQMEALVASRRPLVTLQQAVAGLRGECTLAPGAVVITFDDGFRDNYEEALPILERFGLKATFFLATHYIGTGRIFSRYAECCDGDAALDWDQVREMLARGHDIGGHGRTHRELAGLASDEIVGEVHGCYQDIQYALGQSPAFFCYPRGSESSVVRRAVHDGGYLAACSVYPGTNGSGIDLFALRRTEVAGNDDIDDFLFKLGGGFDGWHRMRQRFAVLAGPKREQIAKDC